MLDLSTVQLHAADLQDGIVGLAATNPASTLRRSAQVLADMARLLDIPVTLSAAPRPGGPAVIAELTERLPEAPLFVRSGPCAWDDQAVRQAITARDRRNLVLCGVLTEVVVLHTALAAIEAGFTVQVLIDACGGMSARTEEAALRQIEAAGGRVTSVAGFISDLVRDFTTPTGRQAVSGLHGLLAPAH
ncbi:isochorismatase family protein [Kitasatospora sp. NBC_00240]|uniref:isochorismatase family protein n=1 Tax=Kitasatospora sp. NBC_00240 TaxID=2903567 RepID=UPI00225C0F67|nr:isochorismatase family protein [Kitasatospora sp. NBC_00240]MCX5211956.1 isochorismatase family protein [Kitasatospora sp. NBC_00240]